MPENIIQIDQNLLETRLDRLITEKMTQILNAMLDAEADEITGAARYERSGGRKAYRAGHYERKLTAKAGRLELKVPKLKGALFESAVIERYRRREQSVEESLIDMYLAGVSTRQVDDISQLLWGDRMPSQTLSDKLKRIYGEIDRWRTRPLESEYPYVFVDGVWHKRSWGGHVENVSVLVAIGINAEGHREVIGVTEGMREDSASWEQFFRGMIERGLKGVRLVVGDRCAGLVATVGSMLPKAKYQRCMVHFMRNVLSKVPPIHREWASAALKAVFAMESRESALDKAEQVAAEMRSRRLRAAANCLREGVGETTTYLLAEFPDGHRRRIRTNNMIERLNRRSAGARASSAASPTGTARSCSSARASGTSPRTNGRPAATSTCPGSMTTSWKRTDHRSMDGHDPKCATFRALPRWIHTVLCTMRSRMASAMVSPPRRLCHSLVASWVANAVLALS